MAFRPRKLSRALTSLELQDPRGDVLADLLGAVLLRNAMYKRIEAGVPWGMQFAARDRVVFYVLARGSARLEVDGEPARSLSAGDVALLVHGSAHTLRDAPTTRPRTACEGAHRSDRCARILGGDGARTSIISGFFELGAGRLPALLERLPRVVTMSAAEPTAGPWLATTVQLLLAESAAAAPGRVLVLQRLADVLFVQALRAVVCHRESSTAGLAGLAGLADPAVHRALDLLHGRVAEPWTVAAIAAAVGMSRSGFAARFAELVGEPPLQYLARWRIARAAEHLRASDDAVGAIASRVGYASVPSFIKAFKRWHGESPRSYRRAHRA